MCVSSRYGAKYAALCLESAKHKSFRPWPGYRLASTLVDGGSCLYRVSAIIAWAASESARTAVTDCGLAHVGQRPMPPAPSATSQRRILPIDAPVQSHVVDS